MEDGMNLDLRVYLTIMAFFLYTLLLAYVHYLLNKQVNTNMLLVKQTAINCEGDNNSTATLWSPFWKNEKRRTWRHQSSTELVLSNRKRIPQKRHLAATDLTNIEPIAKEKYQGWQIIIDLHDIREFKQHPEVYLPRADIFTWPSVNEIKQQKQKLKLLKNKNIHKEEPKSLHDYIQYTDRILLQRVDTCLQELLQLVEDGCKLIETEHQVIVKVSMVKDAIGLWKNKKLNNGTNDMASPQTYPNGADLSSIKSGKKQNDLKQAKKENNLMGQLKKMKKQSASGSFKDNKNRKVGRQLNASRRKVYSKSDQNSAEQELQEKEVMLRMTDD